uniref:ribonuclease E n=1 Tax=Pseudoerythrocladia kornmannii TaxID=753682 RepID=UPI001BEFEBB4|nr:ribonuclease E [Pseudoerythrocladia kornmannii]QUE28187.1 Rne [Pseudoerythrocladia kornmannii]UNJ16691.1 ribonuclease E [Pseudoerythrocladia kornmannii]
MQQKIIISELYNIAAVISNNKVQELIFAHKHYQVNNIYIGIVNKIFPSINAAFVNINHNYKSGFIHSSDINFISKKRNFSKLYNIPIHDMLIGGQKILVQILKESNINKGPRLTTNLTLIGRYLVLIPFSKSICISRTVEDSEERNYLKALAVLIKPATMGLLLKSHIIGVSENAVIEELNYLKKQWIFIQKLACISLAPKLLYSDNNLSYKITRDFYTPNVSSILVDTLPSFSAVTRYLSNWLCLPEPTRSFLHLYEKIDDTFEKHGITDVFQKATVRKVDLPLGSYLYIETVEAMTIIDVNSGGFNKLTASEDAVLQINIDAAKEIAYQLKIRNIAGLIIVDFIDMQSENDQLQLLKNFQKFLYSDLARPQIVQLSELGLVELTRRRSGRNLHEVFPELVGGYDYYRKRKREFSKIFDTKIQCLDTYIMDLSDNLKVHIKASIFPQIKYSSKDAQNAMRSCKIEDKLVQFDFFQSLTVSNINIKC